MWLAVIEQRCAKQNLIGPFVTHGVHKQDSASIIRGCSVGQMTRPVY